jgi:hypothetical protein
LKLLSFKFLGGGSIHKIALWTLLSLALAHIIATWGIVGMFGGDVGRWLGEVERFAHHEVPYTEYTWSFPPASLWLLGQFARMFSPNVTVIWIVTSIIFLLIMAAHYCYVFMLVRSCFVFPVILSSFLLATAYACLGSAPLPIGTYTPALPVGFLFLQFAIILSLKSFSSPRLIDAIGLGASCGLCILTKQDFWIPALYVAGVVCGVLVVNRQPRCMQLASTIVLTFCLTVLIGIVVIVAQGSWGSLARIATGDGMVAETSGRLFPSWERLTTEIVMMALLGSAVLLCLIAGGTVRFHQIRILIGFLVLIVILGCAIHLYMSFKAGLKIRAESVTLFSNETEKYLAKYSHSDKQLLMRAESWLRQRLKQHLFPAILPAVLLLVVCARRRRFDSGPFLNTLMFLLGLCITVRFKRLFEHVDWYHVLLEIPVYLLFLELCINFEIKSRIRGLTMTLLVLVAVGGYCYWYWGVGFLTRNNAFRAVETDKGKIWLMPDEAAYYHQIRTVLQRLDPSGVRPLFAFGYSGSFNYFLNRENPTPLTVGFAYSNIQPAKIVTELHTHFPPPFLLDYEAFRVAVEPSNQLKFPRWEIENVQNHYMRVDRCYFEQVSSQCTKAAEIPDPERPYYTIYDCDAQLRGAGPRNVQKGSNRLQSGALSAFTGTGWISTPEYALSNGENREIVNEILPSKHLLP